MNRDTRYSSGVFDLSHPLTITLPAAGDRFQSMTVSDNHPYIKSTTYEPGTYVVTKDSAGSRYVQITVRTFVIADSQEDNKEVTALQDQIKVSQESIGSFEIPNWDSISHEETRAHLLGLLKGITNSKNMFGNEAEVDSIRHLIGTAAGYGGISEEHATYLNVCPEKNDGQTAYVLNVPMDVPVDAFWSISVYNDKGYFHKNEFESYSFNNVSAIKNSDGSITIHLGGNTDAINFIPISPG